MHLYFIGTTTSMVGLLQNNLVRLGNKLQNKNKNLLHILKGVVFEINEGFLDGGAGSRWTSRRVRCASSRKWEPLNEKNPCRAVSHSRAFSKTFSGYQQLFSPTSRPLTKRPLLISSRQVINQVRWVRPNWQLGSSHRVFYSEQWFKNRARKYDGLFISLSFFSQAI